MRIPIRGTIVDSTSGGFYDWLGMENTNPDGVRESLDKAGGEDIIIEIASNGGYVTAGYEIYNALKDYSGKVTAHISHAMSAASIIACAADKVLISEAAVYMIHNPSNGRFGDYHDMEKEADALKEFAEGIINVYEKKTGLSREEIAELMDNETHMSPEKAIQYGFADGYIDRPDIIEAVASDVPVISQQKAKDALTVINLAKEAGGIEELAEIVKRQQADITALDTLKSNKEDDAMTLNDFLEQNEEARAEYDAALNERSETARDEAIEAENNRLHELDGIAGSIPADALNEAKYGQNRTDAKTLAYNTMLETAKLGKQHLEDAQADAEDSGVNNVENFKPDMGEVTEDESDTLASYVNRRKGVKNEAK